MITVAQEDGSSKAVPAWTEDCFTYHTLTTRLHVRVVSWLCLPVCLSVCVPPLCTHILYVIKPYRAYEPHRHMSMSIFNK